MGMEFRITRGSIHIKNDFDLKAGERDICLMMIF